MKMRPGGFSSEGHRFVAMLQQELDRTLSTRVTVVTPPPATNQATYWRVTAINALTLCIWWTVVFLIVVSVTASVSLYFLRMMPVSVPTKQGMFVFFNTWLATPLPFPATIVAVLLPNAFAFPWTNAEYYQSVQDAAFVSFPVAFLLCLFIALWLSPKFRLERGDA